MLSVIVPCYNEELNIRPFFTCFEKTFEACAEPYELIFVNDGSSDATEQEFKKLIEKNPDANIHAIDFSRNFGKEAAILAGLKRSRGDYIALIDADLQQDPAILIKMLDMLKSCETLDCVAAVQEERNEGYILSTCKKTFYNLINHLSDVNFKQGASDFRVFRASVKEAILSLPERNRFSKGLFAFVGFQTAYMPYRAKERKNGKTKWSFRKLFRYAIDGIASYTVKPLIWIFNIGLLLLFSALVYGIVLLCGVCAGTVYMTYQWCILLLLVVSGIQSIGMGVLGKYLAMNYEESKQRPAYIIKSEQTTSTERKTENITEETAESI